MFSDDVMLTIYCFKQQVIVFQIGTFLWEMLNNEFKNSQFTDRKNSLKAVLSICPLIFRMVFNLLVTKL